MTIEITQDYKCCPHCGQTVKEYRRKIHITMAHSLEWAIKRHGNGYFETKQIPFRCPDFTKLKYWELIEPGEGWTWKVTNRGADFYHGLIMLPKYALVYNGHCRDFEGGDISFAQIIKGREIFYKEEI